MTGPSWALADVSVDPEGLFSQAAERIVRLVGDLCVIALAGERPEVFEPVAVSHRSESTRRLVEGESCGPTSSCRWSWHSGSTRCGR